MLLESKVILISALLELIICCYNNWEDSNRYSYFTILPVGIPGGLELGKWMKLFEI